MRLATLIPHDKALHALGGVAIFATVRAGALLCGLDPRVCGLVAFAAVVLAGLLKELYDLRHRDKHTPDLVDAAATVMGGILASASGADLL